MGILEKISPKAKPSLNKEKHIQAFQNNILKLRELQNLMYAENKRSMLIVLQGMDASGKDSTVKHVFGQMNPMGIRVKPFKKPTKEEYSYDFLRRIHKHTPHHGMLHIFNRSHYEDILVPSVHKLLSSQKIKRRYDYINAFENMLIDHNTIIFKFFLHISKEEQRARFKKRLTNPTKMWKYDPSDISEAKKWDEYTEVYETIFEKCSPEIKWDIIPADDKWYRNYLISKIVIEQLETLNMKYPKAYFDNKILTKTEIENLI